MLGPLPIGFPQLAVLWTVSILLIGSVLLVAVRNRRQREGASRASTSSAGILLQSAGFGAVWFGALNPALPWAARFALLSTVAVLLVAVGAVLLFSIGRFNDGNNWNIDARTRSDHQLVRTGPFRLLRHPICGPAALSLLSPREVPARKSSE
jgi:protein-S-isoprenylcysteine O-methyltransferase Ste14